MLRRKILSRITFECVRSAALCTGFLIVAQLISGAPLSSGAMLVILSCACGASVIVMMRWLRWRSFRDICLNLKIDLDLLIVVNHAGIFLIAASAVLVLPQWL